MSDGVANGRRKLSRDEARRLALRHAAAFLGQESMATTAEVDAEDLELFQSVLLELEEELNRQADERATDVAWVEIYHLRLHCTCGHVTDYTRSHTSCDASPKHACEGCGREWGTPGGGDCEAVNDGRGNVVVPPETVEWGNRCELLRREGYMMAVASLRGMGGQWRRVLREAADALEHDAPGEPREDGGR